MASKANLVYLPNGAYKLDRNGHAKNVKAIRVPTDEDCCYLDCCDNSIKWLSTAGETADGILTLSGNAVNDETVTIGSKVYTWTTDFVDVVATGVLTLTGNAVDTETVVIGNRTYTFLDTFVDADYNVHIGATASDTIDNLISAITGVATGSAVAGTDFPTTPTVHETVTAAQGAGDTMDVDALTAGVAGNSIVTNETLTNGSWGAGTLTGGETNNADGKVLVGGSASVSIDNLIAAINGTGAPGVDYSSLTTQNTQVSASAGTGDTMNVSAIEGGVAGNSIATTETMTNGSWGGATLSGGTDTATIQKSISLEALYTLLNP